MFSYYEQCIINFIGVMYRMQTLFFQLPKSPSETSGDTFSGISTPTFIDHGEGFPVEPEQKNVDLDLILEEVEETLKPIIEEVKQNIIETKEELKQKILSIACDKSISLFNLSEQLRKFKDFENNENEKCELLILIQEQKKIQTDRLKMVSNMIKNLL